MFASESWTVSDAIASRRALVLVPRDRAERLCVLVRDAEGPYRMHRQSGTVVAAGRDSDGVWLLEKSISAVRARCLASGAVYELPSWAVPLPVHAMDVDRSAFLFAGELSMRWWDARSGAQCAMSLPPRHRAPDSRARSVRGALFSLASVGFVAAFGRLVRWPLGDAAEIVGGTEAFWWPGIVRAGRYVLAADADGQISRIDAEGRIERLPALPAMRGVAPKMALLDDGSLLVSRGRSLHRFVDGVWRDLPELPESPRLFAALSSTELLVEASLTSDGRACVTLASLRAGGWDHVEIDVTHGRAHRASSAPLALANA